MLYKNLTAKELYSSIYDTSIIEEMFMTGLKIGSTQLAISAMEELIIRGNTDIIQRGLDYAFKEGYIKFETSMCTMIGRSLCESCREADPILRRLGKSLFKAKMDDPFIEFMNYSELIAQELKRQRETKERLQKLTDDSLLEWMKKALSNSGVDQSVIDRWFSEMTPAQFVILKRDVMGYSN